MRGVTRALIGAAMIVTWTALPAGASAPATASCPGQELSAVGPVFRSDLGAFVAFEAQNPELEGWSTFGEEISTFALADRAHCPEE